MKFQFCIFSLFNSSSMSMSEFIFSSRPLRFCFLILNWPLGFHHCGFLLLHLILLHLLLLATSRAGCWSLRLLGFLRHGFIASFAKIPDNLSAILWFSRSVFSRRSSRPAASPSSACSIRMVRLLHGASESCRQLWHGNPHSPR